MTAWLEARDLAMSFGRRRVLEDVNLALSPGELVGIVGENGSGKSTLLKLLIGRLRAERGSVTRRGRLGYCPQDALVFERLTVDENFQLFAAAYGLSDWRSRARELQARLRFEPQSGQRAGEVSGGTRQKLNLALALLHDPDLLLLDEPYAGFDWESYLVFWQLASELRARGRAVLVVSHFLHDRERLDRVCSLEHGRLSC